MKESGYHDWNQRSRSRSNSPHRRDQYREEKATPRFKIEETRTLMLEGVQQSAQIQKIFNDLSISIGTSLPDQTQINGNNIHLKYPSAEAAKSVFQHLKGQITLGNKKIKIQYYPIRKIDLSLSYDWYCDKCDYKNFARRFRCYRCESEKNSACRMSYSTQPTVNKPLVRDESNQNCSLMVRGSIISQIQQNVLLEAFQAFAPVRDIRQIKNKLTDRYKDFAFIEFYSQQQTAQAYRLANDPSFKLAGQRITVMYSRNKADDDFSKPMPYQSEKKEKKAKNKPQQQDNYYHRQRQREIEQQKARPSITMDQLKQKREQELKKSQPAAKQLNEQQSKRRQAEQLAKQWEKQMKILVTMYICPLCSRKFQSLEQMKLHQKNSELHKFQINKLQLSTLTL